MKHTRSPVLPDQEDGSSVLARAILRASVDKTPIKGPQSQEPQTQDTLVLEPNWRLASDTKHAPSWSTAATSNHAPSKAQMIDVNAVPEFILKGWAPDAPRITEHCKITTLGPCFAADIADWLEEREIPVLNTNATGSPRRAYECSNSFAMREQFELAWKHAPAVAGLGESFEDQAEIKRVFDETDIFILTLDRTEVWFDATSRKTLSHGLSAAPTDDARHRLHVSTFEENLNNLRSIYKLMRANRPDAKIILSLSPTRQSSTMREQSCISANSVSKSVLRAAIDAFMCETAQDDLAFYWPSYEIILEGFGHTALDSNPKEPVREYITQLFEHVWCQREKRNDRSLSEAWIKAAVSTGLLPRDVLPLVEKRKPRQLRLAIKNACFSPNPKLDAAIKKMLAGLRDEWLAAHALNTD